MVTDSYVEGPVSINTGLEEWVTPECILSNLSECHIIGNKMKSFLTEDLNILNGKNSEEWLRVRLQMRSAHSS
jgi:hypothetical protein